MPAPPNLPSLPPWLTRLSAVLFFGGLLTMAVGPIVLAAVAPLDPNAAVPPAPPEDPEAFQAFQAERMEELDARFGPLIWLFPLAGAMTFSGAIGLLLVWVTRPLGSDLDEPGKP